MKGKKGEGGEKGESQKSNRTKNLRERQQSKFRGDAEMTQKPRSIQEVETPYVLQKNSC